MFKKVAAFALAASIGATQAVALTYDYKFSVSESYSGGWSLWGWFTTKSGSNGLITQADLVDHSIWLTVGTPGGPSGRDYKPTSLEFTINMHSSRGPQIVDAFWMRGPLYVDRFPECRIETWLEICDHESRFFEGYWRFNFKDNRMIYSGDTSFDVIFDSNERSIQLVEGHAPPPGVIPLPPTALLLLSALGALIWRRRGRVKPG